MKKRLRRGEASLLFVIDAVFDRVVKNQLVLVAGDDGDLPIPRELLRPRLSVLDPARLRYMDDEAGISQPVDGSRAHDRALQTADGAVVLIVERAVRDDDFP